jgi:hypothetical protein
MMSTSFLLLQQTTKSLNPGVTTFLGPSADSFSVITNQAL